MRLALIRYCGQDSGWRVVFALRHHDRFEDLITVDESLDDAPVATFATPADAFSYAHHTLLATSVEWEGSTF